MVPRLGISLKVTPGLDWGRGPAAPFASTSIPARISGLADGSGAV